MHPKKEPDSVDDYIAGFPTPVQRALKTVRQAIRKAAPEAQEVISYRIPTFKFNGYLVHFGAFRNHIGFFPTKSGAEAFKRESTRFRTGPGTLRFPLEEPMPVDLIGKIVTYRVKQNRRKRK